MLKNPKGELEKAQKDKTALAHFNVNNLEMVKAVSEAANATSQPIFLAITENAIKYAGLEYLTNIVKTASQEVSVDLFLHLDHGKDLEVIKQAVRVGFTSIMFDGSRLSYKENVKQTKQVREIVGKDICLEAELGHVGYHGKAKSNLTDPEEAQQFVVETKIDSLAISIGTIHGIVKDMQLSPDRLNEIDQAVNTPLVVHGSSGLSDQQIQELKDNGANKFNIDSEIRAAFMAGIREKDEATDPRLPLGVAMDRIRELAKDKIKIITK